MTLDESQQAGKPSREEWGAIVIGGGFFGASLALLLKKRIGPVLVLERENEMLLRASYNNQARVHAGYHYPRSLMTAVRSRINFPRFVEDFAGCIVSDFDKYYAVARTMSKVTADQFRLFMQRVGAPLQPAPAVVKKLFNSDLVEEVFKVRECAFDAAKLRRMMQERLAENSIHVSFGVEAERVSLLADGRYELDCAGNGERHRLSSQWVFNCTYSGINRLRLASHLPILPLKHEITEMVLVEPPPELHGLAITLMCGPFFSLMPFPDRNLWTLSHVRYTPHHSWKDAPGIAGPDPYLYFKGMPKQTHGPLMIRDAARYMPAMGGCRQRDSLWEVKTVLPQSELDDGRPILFHRDPQFPGFISIMGGKLDNIYDLPQDLDDIGLVEK